MISPAAGHAIAQEPDRLLVTFEADALDLVLPEIPRDDLVEGLRGIEMPPALAIDLRGPLESYAIATEPAIVGRRRVDHRPAAGCVRDAGARRAAHHRDRRRPRPASPRSADSGRGRCGQSPSTPATAALTRALAVRTARWRKDVTLEIARQLASRIERDLGLTVVLTRTSDTTVALDERAAIANNNRADLFISLHVNASVRETATGAEVFHLSLAEYSEEVRAVESGGLPVPTVGGGTRTLDIVPWEMAQNAARPRIGALGCDGRPRIGLRLPMSPRGLQQAPFRVLVGANMPAVLVEMGFISTPSRRRSLTSPSFQASIVNSLLRSIIQYRDEMARAAAVDRPDPSGPHGPA